VKASAAPEGLASENGAPRLDRRPAAPASRVETLARQVTQFVGSTAASVTAVAFVVGWAVTGPFFGYSETTIVTFLMVFLIQRSQNKDSLAVHLKLNEIVAALGGASNRLVTAEDLGEEELEVLHRHYKELARYLCRQDLQGAHSVEEEKGTGTLPASDGPRREPAERS